MIFSWFKKEETHQLPLMGDYEFFEAVLLYNCDNYSPIGYRLSNFQKEIYCSSKNLKEPTIELAKHLSGGGFEFTGSLIDIKAQYKRSNFWISFRILEWSLPTIECNSNQDVSWLSHGEIKFLRELVRTLYKKQSEQKNDQKRAEFSEFLKNEV